MSFLEDAILQPSIAIYSLSRSPYVSRVATVYVSAVGGQDKPV
jgi:hypothetical protein